MGDGKRDQYTPNCDDPDEIERRRQVVRDTQHWFHASGRIALGYDYHEMLDSTLGDRVGNPYRVRPVPKNRRG